MKNMTKAEMSKEIKQLRDGATADIVLITKLRSDIEDLQADKQRLHDLEDEYRKEIKDLQDVVIALRNDCNNLTAAKHEKANKVKDLEQVLKSAVDMRDYWLEEKDSEIKELRDENKNLSLIVDRKRNDYNDINDLRNALVQRSAEKSKEIKRLHQHIDDDEITIQNKQNEINNLRCDYDHRQAIITEMSKEIKDLKVALASAEKLNDARKFHNATVAMGNPLYFQGV